MSVGSIIGDLWRFVRANLRTIAIWSALNLAISVVMRLALRPAFQAHTEAALHGGVPQVAFGQAFGVLLIAMPAFLVLYVAVFRTVLFPERHAFAYLRLGIDELRVLGLVVVLTIGMAAAMLVSGIVLGVFAGLLGVVLGSGRSSMLLVSMLVATLYAGVAFAAVRLSVAMPLTLLRGRITIGPAWRLTRGHFWTLFGAYLLVSLGMIAAALIVTLPTTGPILSAAMHAGDPGGAARLAQLQTDQMTFQPNARSIATLVLGSLIGGVWLAVAGGAPAIATLQLLEQEEAP